MRKLILISTSILLLFACKKEELKPEVLFLKGKWQLEDRIVFSKYIYTLPGGPIYKAVKDSSFLEMEFNEKGNLIYSVDGKSKKFRITDQNIRTNNFIKSTFIPSLNQVSFDLKLKDSKNQRFYFNIKFNLGIDTIIMADYFMPTIENYNSSLVSYDPYSSDDQKFITYQNPRHGKFKKN